MTNPNIPKSISELLYDYSTVVIPGFGGFTTSYNSSSIDYVQGVVSPPSHKLEFNENLAVNDGVLVNHLQEKFSISQEQASDEIEKFIENSKGMLKKSEIVEIPKVGRLYMDYEQNLKFLPEGVNYNSKSFGLPAVQFFPVMREKANASAAQKKPRPNAAAKKSPILSESQGIPSWMQYTIIPLIVISFCVILVSMFLFSDDAANAAGGERITVNNSDRINTKPTHNENGNVIDDDEDLIDFQNELAEDAGNQGNENIPAQPDSKAQDEINYEDTSPAENTKAKSPAITTPQKAPEVAKEKEIDTEGPTINPKSKEAFIVIHSFGNNDNAQKFVVQLFRDGYAAEARNEDNWHKVGIYIDYNNKKELENKLADLKEEYSATPYVWEE